MKINWLNNAIGFLKEVKAEMKKVSWPQRKDVTGTTIVTIVSTLLLALYLYIADKLFVYLIKYIYSLGV